ncbi:hypothetical protein CAUPRSCDRAFT_12596 [Caulochytrium protostelioides]|uniref:Uncharacterized protein n=1 Tax=Caulochytrium protostelioides TaxID=1555241 RepID=A0A4P9WWT6_9FUNG|nr:hypothetical protein CAUPRSCDRAFT_12596 [Caulochytrium protostelioides]
MCSSGYSQWPCPSSYLMEPRYYGRDNHLYETCVTRTTETVCSFQEYRDGPSPIWLSPAYMQEVVDTATAIVHQNAFVSFLMRSDVNANGSGPKSSYDDHNPLYAFTKGTKAKNHTAIIQFGDPDLASQSATFGDFNATQTYKNLVNAGLERSLQALVLQAGGYMRLHFQLRRHRCYDLLQPASRCDVAVPNDRRSGDGDNHYEGTHDNNHDDHHNHDDHYNHDDHHNHHDNHEAHDDDDDDDDYTRRADDHDRRAYDDD